MICRGRSQLGAQHLDRGHGVTLDDPVSSERDRSAMLLGNYTRSLDLGEGAGRLESGCSPGADGSGDQRSSEGEQMMAVVMVVRLTCAVRCTAMVVVLLAPLLSRTVADSLGAMHVDEAGACEAEKRSRSPRR